MKKFFKYVFGCISHVILIAVTVESVMAGGLVDTNSSAFDNADFDTYPSEEITNSWWTLPAGRNFLYFSETEDECTWNLVEVLDLTTDNFEGIYAGVDARIVLDREWVDEECEYSNFEDIYANIAPEEVTYDWYAQDSKRNIWYMGEDTWDGESSEGSFIAGCNGAEAGIVILGEPFKGAFYQQEMYEDEAEDRAKVLNFYTEDNVVCMKTKEWTPLEPGEIEHKYYCNDGTNGRLSLIKELKGKTVIVELIDIDISPPSPPLASPPSPIPNCED